MKFLVEKYEQCKHGQKLTITQSFSFHRERPYEGHDTGQSDDDLYER
jgi:hypothetical protein